MPSYALGSFSYDPATFTAHWSLSGPAAIGADRLTLDLSAQSPAGVHDQNGAFLNLGNDFVHSLSILPGDINGDGTVNFADVLTLIQDYGQSNSTINEGDLTGDGTVNFNDVLALVQNYGSALPASAALAPATIFSSTAIPSAGSEPLDLLRHHRRRR